MSDININNQKNIENENPNFKMQRLSTGKSFFLVEGKILNINPKDKKIHTGYFDFKNFIFNPNLDKIGSGAFGDVYLGINKIDKKEYAIKHISKKRVLENNCSLSIIYKEIETQIIIEHPNIIRLYSYYENKDDIYLILEYLNKGTLFSKIRKKKKLSEKESFHYFIQILNAINFLHENHFVHRDIKPENILLDSNNNVKLCDFGWCVNLKNNETRKTFCGTFEYMAPEIVYEENYDTSVDIWALGILLYEMLHGYSPFRAKDNLIGDDAYKDIFRNIIKLEFNIDRNDLSDECKNIIYKLLESEKDKRICSKEIFAQDWVKKFEKEKKKEIIRLSLNKKNNGDNNNNNHDNNVNYNNDNNCFNENINSDINNNIRNNKNQEDKKNRERIIKNLKEQQNDFFKENEDEIRERRRKEEEKKKKEEEKKRKEEEERKMIEKDIQNGYKPLIKKKSKSTDLLCDDFYEDKNNNNKNNYKTNEQEYFDFIVTQVKNSNKKGGRKKRDLSKLSIQEKNIIKNKSTFNISSKHIKNNKNSFENYHNNNYSNYSNENNHYNNNFLNIHNNNQNKNKFSNVSNIKNDQSNIFDEIIESSFVKDVKEVVEIDALETTKASSKKGNNYYTFYNPNEVNSNDVYNTLKILEKAEIENKKMREEKNKKKVEETFIDKLLKPFKCGD